jgi:hypothetical protein
MMFLFSDLFVEKDTPNSVMVLNNDIGTNMLKKSHQHQRERQNLGLIQALFRVTLRVFNLIYLLEFQSIRSFSL